jgi:RNase P subunit RPR2
MVYSVAMNKTIKQKANQFSVKAAQLYRHLSLNKKETVLSEQYLRAATSVGRVSPVPILPPIRMTICRSSTPPCRAAANRGIGSK